MTVSAFFDTNVLVYAAIGAGRDEPKRKRAIELVETIDFGASAQVLQAAEALGLGRSTRRISATGSGMAGFGW